jgi:hypothetical protein
MTKHGRIATRYRLAVTREIRPRHPSTASALEFKLQPNAVKERDEVKRLESRVFEGF